MKVWFHLLAVAAATMDVSHSDAATLQRCIAPGGHVTYTAHGCPSQGEQTTITTPNAYSDGSDARTTAPKSSASAQQSTPNDLVIVGVRDDGCGNRVTGSSRREAIIRKEIRTGMTRRDVESMLGRPDKVTGQNGQLRYYYQDRQGNRRQVSFDREGCVRK